VSFQVRLTPEAKEDLEELHAFLAERDAAAALRAIATLRKAWGILAAFPYSCRKAEGTPLHPVLRELVITFGKTGYVALFLIEDDTVTVVAVRHQREDDYH
jgi:plasmid stabilization system protein ParE